MNGNAYKGKIVREKASKDNIPDVSVIVPAYNMERWIGACIESIVSQSLKNIEIIVVDDGSQDNTLSIVKKYAQEDSRIKWIQCNHSYAGAARNQGINIASGDYVSFVDADDMYIDSEVLEYLLITAKRNNVMICGGGMQNFDITGNPCGTQSFIFDEERLCVFDENPIYLGFTRFIYKRKLLIDNNIFFPELRHDEDGAFMCRAASVAKYYLILPRVVYYRRQIPKSLILYGDEEALIGNIEVIKTLNKTEAHRKLYWEIIYEISDVLPFVFCRFYWGINKESIIKNLCELNRVLWDDESRKYLNMDDVGDVNDNWILNRYGLLEQIYKTYREVIDKANVIYIYGAGTIGGYARILIEKILKKNIESYVVSEKKENRLQRGVTVIGVEKLNNITDALVIVAMHKRWHRDIDELLHKYNFRGDKIFFGNDIKNYISVLSDNVASV